MEISKTIITIYPTPLHSHHQINSNPTRSYDLPENQSSDITQLPISFGSVADDKKSVCTYASYMISVLPYLPYLSLGPSTSLPSKPSTPTSRKFRYSEVVGLSSSKVPNLSYNNGSTTGFRDGFRMTRFHIRLYYKHHAQEPKTQGLRLCVILYFTSKRCYPFYLYSIRPY